MSDIKCPYCGEDQDIYHDDGQGYEEDQTHQQECGKCEKYFIFTTSIEFHYEVNRADCLNGACHTFKIRTRNPKAFSDMECRDCGNKRKPTDEEMKIILADDNR